MIKIIEKIEGEAKLNFSYHEGIIDFVDIEFFSHRGIEKILQNKPALDALVINPRVCGICGHAHLLATVKAIENCYHDIKLSSKALIVRELTLNFELIQNHFKWFYLTILPLLNQKQMVLKATYPSQIISQAIAILAGQYPHNSYAIVGGITSEITALELVKVKALIGEVLSFFEKEVVQVDTAKFLGCKDIDKIFRSSGDLPNILSTLKAKNLLHSGKSYDRFIVFGENSYFSKGKSISTRVTTSIDERYIKEFAIENSKAKNVTYKDKYYEVGPLSRAMLNKTPLIKEFHRRYKDSIATRIVARVCEIVQLLHHCKKLIKDIYVDEPSFIAPQIDIQEITSTGVASVEAARGSLVHKIQLQKGIIKDYTIITPTQWNLGNGDKTTPAIAQNAIIGESDTNIAELIFKSFDVCSACTTH